MLAYAGLRARRKTARRLPGRALVGAEFVPLFAAEGVGEAVFQEAAGWHDDRGLGELFQHAPELLRDFGGEMACQGALLDAVETPHGYFGLPGESQAESEQVVFRQEGAKDLGADAKGVVLIQRLRRAFGRPSPRQILGLSR